MLRLIDLNLMFTIMLCSSSAFAQFEPPRNDSGKPDLQGYWSNASLTKMERDPAYSDLGLVIPSELAAEITNNHPQVVRQMTDDNQVWKQLPNGADLSRGRGYNAFWVAPGSQFAIINGEVRSSMITYPTNGLIPYSEDGKELRRENRAKYSGIFSDQVTMGTDGPESRALHRACGHEMVHLHAGLRQRVDHGPHLSLARFPRRTRVQMEFLADTS